MGARSWVPAACLLALSASLDGLPSDVEKDVITSPLHCRGAPS